MKENQRPDSAKCQTNETVRLRRVTFITAVGLKSYMLSNQVNVLLWFKEKHE